MTQRLIASAFFGLLLAISSAIQANDSPCRESTGGQGEARAVIAAVDGLQKALTSEQRAALSRPFDRDSAIRWSNLPVGIAARGPEARRSRREAKRRGAPRRGSGAVRMWPRDAR